LRADPDIAGLAAGGSFINGTLDEFSDLDLVVVVQPGAWPGILERRHSLAAALGPLLAAFTGEHVGEPRLLICLYGPPLIHVDLKFLPAEGLRDRVEDPVLLWDRNSSLAPLLTATRGRYPGPDRQWIEDRFWIWVHYAATKLARGELFEVLNFLAFLRGQVLGPLLLAAAGAQPNGVRRLEQHVAARADRLSATVARYDRQDAGRALQSAVGLYQELRGAGRPSATEPHAVAFLDQVTGNADAGGVDGRRLA
jgi:hypothetical protein